MMSNLHRHQRQPIEKAGFRANGPPIIEEHLQRSPHRDPPADRQTFAGKIGERGVGKPSSHEIREHEQRGEKREPDGEAHASPTEQIAQPASFAQRPLREVLMHRFAHDGSLVGPPRSQIQVYEQREQRVARSLTSRADDELRGVRLEVAIAERRGVDRMEQLPQLGNAYLYDLLATPGQ